VQNRFLENSKLTAMTALDLQALDRRAHGRRSRRTHQLGDPKAIIAFLKGPDFSLAASKGQPADCATGIYSAAAQSCWRRTHDGGRSHPRKGFLHQVSELDTLGVDKPETKWQAALKWSFRGMWRRCLLSAIACLAGRRFAGRRGHGLCLERRKATRSR